MNYVVVLVQQGISAQSHPVTGKSGKLYGNAIASPAHGGVILQMPLQDYLEHAHDIVGNTAPTQQWVPEFVSLAQASRQHKCDRCSKPAVAIWGQFHYCLDDAPDNAIMMDGTEQTVGQRKGKAPVGAGTGAEPQPDAAPKVEERLSGPIEEERELPAEHLPAPSIGTEREGQPPAKTEAGVFAPEKPAPAAEPKPEPKAPAPAPAAESAIPEKAKNAIEAITAGVVEAVMPRLDAIVSAKIAAAAKATEHKGKKKPAKTPRPPSEFSQLQQQAKGLGINSFGKNAKQLREEIAKKSK